MSKFNETVRIYLADTDATGVIFFPKLFEKCVIILEHFLKAHQLHSFMQGDSRLPVVEALGHYLAPVSVGDELEAQLSASAVGRTSISLDYKFFTRHGKLAMEAKIVHVCLSTKTGQKQELPTAFKEIFAQILSL